MTLAAVPARRDFRDSRARVESPVSSASSFDTKERVKQAIDIVDLVGGYLSLRRQGRNFVGLCPWHDDRRPSLQVSPERQTFKCWVCNIGGDVFSFVMQREGVTFPEALAMLAERAGIVLEPRRERVRSTAPDGQPDGQGEYFDGMCDSGAAGPGPDCAAAPDKPTLYKAMAWAVEQFHRCLLDDAQAEIARQYLAERGISDESIRRFQLGFAPDSWDWLAAQVRHKPSAVAALERVGVLGKSDRGGHYDRFKGRVLFPICNVRGKPIAIGGRILPEFAQKANQDRPPAKYINSPETSLFSKSREFYALDLARNNIFKTKHAVLMEGYTDVVVAHQCGLTNCLAVLGTAIGEKHLRNLGDPDGLKITLVLDGDEAGRRRAAEILQLFVAADANLWVVTLPNDLDPCDFLQQRGKDEFDALLRGAVDALDHGVSVETNGVDPNDTYAMDRAAQRVLETIAAANAMQSRGDASRVQLREQQCVTRLSRKFRIDESTLWDRLASLRRKRTRASLRAGERDKPEWTLQIETWERALLELLLLEPEAVTLAEQMVTPASFATEPAREVFAKLCDISHRGLNPDFDRLILETNDPQLQNLLIELDEHGRAQNIADVPVRIRQSLDNFRWRQEQRRRQEHRSALEDRRLDEQEEVRLLHELLAHERARQGISGPTDG